jgi:hypothetical protein
MQLLDKTLMSEIDEIFFSKRLQHTTKNTCKNMQHVQHPDLLLQHPYVTIAT